MPNTSPDWAFHFPVFNIYFIILKQGFKMVYKIILQSVLIFVLSTSPAIPQPVPLAAFDFNSKPHDLAITPDQSKAVVHSRLNYDPHTTVYDLNEATLIGDFSSSGIRTVDAVNSVAVSNDRAVVLGGLGDAAVGIFDIASSPPVQLASFFADRYPHDVAITPNGELAAVRSRNNNDMQTAFYHLPSVTEIVVFNSETGNDMDAVNSIEVTDTRAINVGGAGNNAVEIYDLSAFPPQLMASFSSNAKPHDLSISPNGDIAVVRSIQNNDYYTLIFDLQEAALIGSFMSTSTFQYDPVESVETSDNRAVVLGAAGSNTVEIFGFSQCESEIDMIPDESPIVVPPGGSFGLTGVITNNTDEPVTTDIWVGVIYQESFFRLMYFNNVPLNPNQTINGHFNQSVPNYAPSGTYQYAAYCGEYPDACDSVSFDFEVTGISIASGNKEWRLDGQWNSDERQLNSSGLALEIHPNPSNASTKIEFGIPKYGHVNLKVYNLLGQEVAELVNEKLTAGEYSVDFNGDKLSSGVYFYNLKFGGNKTVSRKMVLLK
ncbi:MAG: T9SS type A sorting domain-containing protein [candidate division Zixibacteria bacterium]|nr:T9SS type A sorting domain-containing protein [candidate division Zixibacteria bacterium]